MYNFITIGYDCSPAAALRTLGLRNYALPFDWIVSNTVSLEQCFKSNFELFHTSLKYNHMRTRLIDAYGFQFPHDYPFKGKEVDVNTIGEGVIGEETNSHIVENWQEYYSTVKEKYNRRIERFRNIVKSDKPIIVLCRYKNQDIIKLVILFLKYFNKENIYFVNSSNEPQININKINCINVYTEKNNIWNESAIWKEGVEHIIKTYSL
jgi:hypothetical protein